MTSEEGAVVQELVDAVVPVLPLPGNRARVLLPGELIRVKDAVSAVRALLALPSEPLRCRKCETPLFDEMSIVEGTCVRCSPGTRSVTAPTREPEDEDERCGFCGITRGQHAPDLWDAHQRRPDASTAPPRTEMPPEPGPHNWATFRGLRVCCLKCNMMYGYFQKSGDPCSGAAPGRGEP